MTKSSWTFLNIKNFKMFDISLWFLNFRAQKLDGAFFEGFVELQQNQLDEIEEAAKGTLKREALSHGHHDTLSITRKLSKEKVPNKKKLFNI